MLPKQSGVAGGITGSARTAYVLWPPSDGGRKMCETLNEPYTEGAIAIGLVAKANGAARRERSFFLRDSTGLLRDVTQRYHALMDDDVECLHAELLAAISSAWQQAVPFAASYGVNGLHTRRFELPEPFHDKSRSWFDEQIGVLFIAKQIRRVKQGRGFNLAPIEVIETTDELAVHGNS